MSKGLSIYLNCECGCVRGISLRVVCVILLTRLWPNGYYVYPFQVLVDSPLPRSSRTRRLVNEDCHMSYLGMVVCMTLHGLYFGDCNQCLV